MTNLSKLFYIGTGEHFQPVNDFPNVKEFVFVDSQPYTEFYSVQRNYCKQLYRNNFVQDLVSTAKLYGFDMVSETILDETFFWSNLELKQKICYSLFPRLVPKYVNPTLLKFVNTQTNQLVKYYVSTPCPQHPISELELDIKSSDGIILSGFFPHKSILNLFPDKKISLIGYSGTYFLKEEYLDPDDSNNLMQFLHSNHGLTSRHFSNYLYVKDCINEFRSKNFTEESKLTEYTEYTDKKEYENNFIKSKPVSIIFERNTFDDFIKIILHEKN